MAAAIFVYHSTFRSCASKTNSASAKKIPLHILPCESPQFFSYFFLLSLFALSLGLQFHQVFLTKRLVSQRKEFSEVVLL